MPKVMAITGGGGFIGRRLVEKLLNQGYHLRLLLRKQSVSYWENNPRVKIIRGSVDRTASIKELIKTASGLIHLAVEMDSSQPWSSFKKVNVESVKKILGNVPARVKILMVSSVVVYDDTGREIRDETWRLKKSGVNDKYIKSKIEALKVVRASKRKVISVMPSIVVDKSKLTQSLSPKTSWWKQIIWKWLGGGIPGGIMARIGNKKRIMNLVEVNDVAQGIIQAWERGKLGEEYILSGINVSCDDYLKRVAELNQRKFRGWRIPGFVGKLLGIESLVNMNFSDDKAKNKLGYNPAYRW